MNTETYREVILKAAADNVNGTRQQDYGKVEDNFERIAKLWSVFLSVRSTPGRLSATDVAHMMMLLKIARLQTTPQHADSWVDLAGYAACGAGLNQPPTESAPTKAPKK